MSWKNKEEKRLEIAYCIVASQEISDQPDNGLKKGRNM
jgi:hypothetical protein